MRDTCALYIHINMFVRFSVGRGNIYGLEEYQGRGIYGLLTVRWVSIMKRVIFFMMDHSIFYMSVIFITSNLTYPGNGLLIESPMSLLGGRVRSTMVSIHSEIYCCSIFFCEDTDRNLNVEQTRSARAWFPRNISQTRY
jgi:hypothetical protein